MSDWQPVFATESDEAARLYETLQPGIPSYMEPSVHDWLQKAVVLPTMGPSGRRYVDHNFAESAQLILQIRGVAHLQKKQIRTFVKCDIRHAEPALWAAAREEGKQVSLVDMALAYSAASIDTPLAKELEWVLATGKSEYQVAMRGEKVGLAKRVPDGVLFVASEIVGKSGRAGRYLADAWGYCYGLDANPNHAYKSAVLAVETLACPLVEPNNMEGATLGTTIARMRQDGDWRMPFLREDEHFTSPDVLRGMLRSLWRGDYARHANRVWPQDVTQSEAEAALALALALVDMLASNGVVRREAHEIVAQSES
jgi:hypothetical protein